MGTYKQFTGAAPVAHLTAQITGTPTTFTVDNATGFPTGAGSIPFVVCIDRNTASEEKILCSAMSGNVFTIQTRGFDGTVQTNHNSGANVEHVIDADSMNDGQQHIHDTTRDDHTQYARTDGTRAFTGEATVPDLKVSGLTGATSLTRFVGATASGAPTSGTFVVGDYVVDRSGGVWVCTTAGTPGTWTPVGITANPAGRIYPTTSTLCPGSNAFTQVVNMTTDFTKGGVTVSSNGLVVPVAGIYAVSAQITFNTNGGGAVTAGYYNTLVYKNGAAIREFSGYVYTASVVIPSFGNTDVVSLAANDALTLYGNIGGSSQYAELGSSLTWLSVALVSR